MAAFASPEWIEALSAAASGVSIEPSIRLVVEQRIEDGSAEDGVGAAWHFVFADGTVRAAAGPATEPTITLTSSMTTAKAIQAGELSAQRAFLDGELRIGGDLNSLITHRRAFEQVAALMSPAR